jgi:RAB protein geranylgeranyltransferase component A
VEINAGVALRRIQRHLKGFGKYGDFSIVVPMHGGAGELSQAFCRSAAVKGATYILGRSVRQVTLNSQVRVDFDVAKDNELASVMSGYIVRSATPSISQSISNYVEITRSTSIIEGLGGLFPEQTSQGDAVLIVIPPGCLRGEQKLPIQIIVHGGGIGECPVGQCNPQIGLIPGIMYSSIQDSGKSALDELELAEKMILQRVETTKGAF